MLPPLVKDPCGRPAYLCQIEHALTFDDLAFIVGHSTNGIDGLGMWTRRSVWAATHVLCGHHGFNARFMTRLEPDVQRAAEAVVRDLFPELVTDESQANDSENLKG